MPEDLDSRTDDWDADDAPRHCCGLFGAYGVPDAALRCYVGLFSQQHRGQESAGIVVSDGTRVHSKKALGLVSEVFDRRDLIEELSGHIAIGHVRYSTSGSNRPVNVQPLVVNYSMGIIAVAHNGNLVNARMLRDECEAYGSIFQTSTDSEIIVHLLAQPENFKRDRGLPHVLSLIRGAFSLLFLTKDQIMAARDPWGFRPLSIGRLGDGYVFASETCAFDQIGARFEREVQPGELVTVDRNGLRSQMFCSPEQVRPAHCIFEHVYFARPDSMIYGDDVYSVRVRLGMRLAEERPAQADAVIPIPDSGNEAALGYARRAGLPFDMGLVRSHYLGRSFIQPNQAMREVTADLKLNVARHVVEGKRLVVVDDSLVRGTTFRRLARRLRAAGAREIHVRISCPPHRFPCYYGVDFPTSSELLAANRTEAQICEFLGAESIGYLSLEGMLSCAGRPLSHYCSACWTGNYPVKPEDDLRDKCGMEADMTVPPPEARRGAQSRPKPEGVDAPHGR